MTVHRLIVVGALCVVVPVVGACSGTEVTPRQARADAGMQFGTLVVARDVGFANSAPVRGLEDLPADAVPTGYRGARLVDVFFADNLYCIAVGPAPGAAEGSQTAWVTAGVGTSTVHQRTWDPGVTTCDEAMDGIRQVRAGKSTSKVRRMLKNLDRSKVSGVGTQVLEDLSSDVD